MIEEVNIIYLHVFKKHLPEPKKAFKIIWEARHEDYTALGCHQMKKRVLHLEQILVMMQVTLVSEITLVTEILVTVFATTTFTTDVAILNQFL